MRAFAGLFIGGVAVVVLFKLIAAFVLPLVAILFGLIGMVFKLAIFVAVAYFVYALVRNRRREQTV